jgi:hypothetical protein
MTPGRAVSGVVAPFASLPAAAASEQGRRCAGAAAFSGQNLTYGNRGVGALNGGNEWNAESPLFRSQRVKTDNLHGLEL